MYSVSEQFKSAIKSTHRKSTIYGVLTTTSGVEYLLNDGNIIKDSLYITNQIVNNSKLCFGAVYAGECGLVINSTIDRYSLFGATIVLNFLLELEDSTEERLPLGVFTVDTPERIGSKIKLTAVDNMSKFDIAVNEDVNGTWYELLSYVANKCGVALAQTQAELEALHINATNQNYTIQQDKIDTYRDALSYLCMVVCANATINNAGKLKIVQYATSACDSNNNATRLNNCKFSDYTSRYAGIKARFFANENYAPYEASNPDIKGLTLDLGDIPIVGGTADSKNATIDAMLETITQISYVPATLYISSNPAYELGDMITCENVNNTNDSVNTYVMAYKYNYRKKETINCYGDNPLLQNVKSKNDKHFSSMESQISSKDMVIVNATNIKDITIEQKLKDIVSLNFSVNTDCRPICIFTIPFSIDVDGYVEFSLYNGLVAMENATYKGYYEAGEHFATFMYLDDMKKNDRRSLRVLVKCYADTTSAIRIQDARIRTLESKINALIDNSVETIVDATVDTTEPTTTIKALGVKAIAYTQGINGKGEWDGTLEFKDLFNADIPLISDMSVITFGDNLSVNTQIPTPASISELFGEIALNGAMSVIGFTDSVSTAHIIENYVFDTTNGEYNSNYVATDGAYMMKTEYKYSSTEQTIDSGRMCAVAIDYSGITVESVVVVNE